MKKQNKLIFVMILIAVLLSIQVSARSGFGNWIANGATGIENFFADYETFATLIDFFVFSLLFISIFLMGANKALGKSRQTTLIAILLGLMGSIGAVMSGISIVILFPLMKYVVFIIFVIFFYKLFTKMGIKNRWLAAALAFLITLLLAILMYGLMQGSDFTIQGFFQDLPFIWWLLGFLLTHALVFYICYKSGIKNKFLCYLVSLGITILIFGIISYLITGAVFGAKFFKKIDLNIAAPGSAGVSPIDDDDDTYSRRSYTSKSELKEEKKKKRGMGPILFGVGGGAAAVGTIWALRKRHKKYKQLRKELEEVFKKIAERLGRLMQTEATVAERTEPTPPTQPQEEIQGIPEEPHPDSDLIGPIPFTSSEQRPWHEIEEERRRRRGQDMQENNPPS